MSRPVNPTPRGSTTIEAGPQQSTTESTPAPPTQQREQRRQRGRSSSRVVGNGVKGSCSLLDIQGPVFIQEPPDEVDFSNSTGVSVGCAVHGVPKPVITWVLSSGVVVNNVTGLREIHSNGTLAFLPFHSESYRQDVHATVYRCKATNAVGSIISRNVHVRAVVKQHYEVHVYDEFVINGNTAIFKCHVPSFVQDYVTVTSWVRETSDGKRQTIANGGRYIVPSSGELLIRNAQEADSRAGSYRCKTHHRLTGESKFSAFAGRLIVTDPKSSISPRIIYGKSLVTAEEGATVELPCGAQGFPLPSYSWKHIENNHFRSVTFGGRLQLVIGNLHIQNVKGSDSGTYVCFVNNTVGEERLDVELKVSAPIYAYIEPSKQVIDVGKAASFQCSFSGFPITDVQWMKDARPLDNSQQIRYQTRDSLHIASVQREARGMYQCFVSSEQKTVQATAELRLGDAMPQLLHTFKSEVLKPGSGFSLKCIASGNPPPQIRWTLDDLALQGTDRYIMEEQISLHGDVISYVNVSMARAEDSGEYRCLVVNNVGSVDHKQRVDVYGPPFVRSMRNVSAISGSLWSTRCRVSGYPIQSITWEKDGTVLPINHRQKVYPNGTLVVQDVQRVGDAGRYTCIAKGDDITRAAQGDLYVTVMDPPKISPFSFPRDIQEGMRASITCSVFHGNQPITMSWHKDGIRVRPTVDLIVRSFDDLTSTLVVQHITPKDNGNYTCVAQNAAAVVNYTAELMVLVPPRWIHEPKDSSIVTGKSIIIDCQADGQPRPSITWKRAMGRLPGDYVPIDYSSGRNYMYSNGSLLMTSIHETDQGYYLCQANNSVGASLGKVIFLKVHAPAYFLEKFRNQTVKKGHEVVLSCESNGDMPIAIEWKVQNQRLDVRKKSRFSIREKVTSKGFVSELVVSRTSRDDTSEFSCLASNDYGKDQAWIFLIVQEPPEPPQNVKVFLQGSRSLRASWTSAFDGNSPLLRYVIHIKAVSNAWVVDKRNLSVSGEETTAIINDLKPAVEYDTSVAAENAVGIGTPSSPVSIVMAEEVPDGAPLNVTVEPITSQSLKVKWKPPKRENWNGQITGYRIGHRPLDSTDLFMFKTIDFKNDVRGDIVLEDLDKFTKYVIIIQAYNNIGLGPSSQEVVATTLEDVPSQPPSNIKCVSSSSQALHLSWNPPPSQSLNGILRGYRIIYKPNEEFNVKPKLQFRTITATEMELQSLEKYTNYTVQIQAYTGAGDGTKSPSIYCRTKEDVPGPPAHIKVLPMSSDAIIVSWIAPESPNGIITKYTVYMRIVDDYRQSPSSFTLPPSQFYYEARGLNENLQYEFWVKASTIVGEGESSRVISNSPVSTVPAKIASFPLIIVAKRKDDIKLPCRAVGIPTPDREWILVGKPVQVSGRTQIMGDGSLLLVGFRSADAGNYTCRVQNIYAKDEIMHHLINKPHHSDQYPPSPPLVKVKDKTINSITITWTLEDYEDLPVTGMILNCKKEVGEWEEIRLEPLSTYHLIENLACGTRYHLYMVVYNQIGGSEPSDMITVSTVGSAPEVPDREKVIEVNSTFIVLHLPSWPDGGCPILHFLVEYKERDALEWLVVANRVPRQQMVTITDLNPQRAYNLRVNSVNSAGITVVEFDFVTLMLFSGDGTRGDIMEESQASSRVFLNVNVIIPVLSAIIIIIALLVVACVFVHRRHYNGYLYTVRSVQKSDSIGQQPQREASQNVVTTTATTENRSYDQAYTPSQIRKPFENNKNNICESQNGVHDDISPYATFQLPPGRYGDAVDVRFHTFGYEGNKMVDYPPSPQFQYTKVRKKGTLQCHPLNSRGEGIPLNTRPSASKEHLNPLRTASLRKQSDTSLDTCSLQREPLTPSAPPAEFDSCAFDSDTPDIAPSKKTPRILNYVPDILDHKPDSSTSSNESSPEMETPPFHKHDRSRERRVRPCRIALRTVASVDGYSSPESITGDITFSFHKPATPPPGFCDPRDLDDHHHGVVNQEPGSRNSNDRSKKSPSGLAQVEEELIALLKRGASESQTQQQQQHHLLSKEETSNYNDINV